MVIRHFINALLLLATKYIITSSKSVYMCEEKLVRVFSHNFRLFTPGYPVKPHLSENSIECVCHLTADFNAEILITVLHWDTVNNGDNCLSENVSTIQPVSKDQIWFCGDQYYYRSYWPLPIIHTYYHNKSIVGRRGIGGLFMIEVKGGLPLTVRCEDRLHNEKSTVVSPTSMQNTTPTNIRRTKKPIKSEKYRILFVFGIITLGVFVIILFTVIIYIGILFIRRRPQPDTTSDDVALNRMSHSGDPGRHTHLNRDIFISSPYLGPTNPISMGIRNGHIVPIMSPPSYSENPPNYDSIFNLQERDTQNQNERGNTENGASPSGALITESSESSKDETEECASRITEQESQGNRPEGQSLPLNNSGNTQQVTSANTLMSNASSVGQTNVAVDQNSGVQGETRI